LRLGVPAKPGRKTDPEPGWPGVRKLIHNPVARRAAAVALLLASLGKFASGEEPISFVLPAANFQPVAADAYSNDTTPMLSLPAPEPAEVISPEGTDTDGYTPAEAYDPLACPNCNGSGSSGCNCLPPPLPNGQYLDDWMWGCGQWPYANGPGMCDDWKVGCRWHVEADGLILFRPDADLQALFDVTSADQGSPDVFDQFDYAAGGSVSLTSEIPHRAGYQVQARYEGVEEWNASIVYPQDPLNPVGPEFASVQTNLFYTSSLQSGELNFSRQYFSYCHGFCGVRYVRFADEINYSMNGIVAPPLPVDMPPPATTSETDHVHILDLDNNLIGFQIGSRFDIWKPIDRLTFVGFINGGVYYNHVKRTNLMSDSTTQFTSDDTSTPEIDESRTDVSTASNLDISEPSKVAAIGEASITSVYRLNRCWALRAGYQVLWIDGVSTAQDAFLNTGVETRDLLFHGCHFGIECRR
jgi:hypothetical protein